MPPADNVLKNFALFVDGRGFAGNVEELQLPELQLTTEDFRGGGMDMPISVDMGMEALAASFTTTKHDADTLALFGVGPGNTVPLTARGALESMDGTATAVTVTMRGEIKSVSPDAWKPGSKATHQYTVSLSYYKYEQGGTVIHEIDAMNMVRIVNGTDRLAAQRSALGM